MIIQKEKQTNNVSQEFKDSENKQVEQGQCSYQIAKQRAPEYSELKTDRAKSKSNEINGI